MKKILLIFLLPVIVLLSFTSCKKVIATVFGGTNIDAGQIQDTIPAIIYVFPNEVPLASYSFDINLDSSVKASTSGVFGANAVNSIKLKQINFALLNADPLSNLSNFESARITLQSNSNNTPVEIMNTSFADTTASSFTYTPSSGPELLSYMKGNSITYIFYAKVRRETFMPLIFTVDVTLRAD